MLNPQLLAKAFPILEYSVRGKRLIYLDSASTTQKPQAVLDRMMHFYTHENANVHRGIHTLAQWATTAFEDARSTIATFINAKDPAQCIFVRGATEGINLVAYGLSQTLLKPGDEVLISYMEHHSNLVPWQVACQKTGAILKAIPLTKEGDLDLQAYEALLTNKTKILALTHVSNMLGTVNPLESIIKAAHAVGALVLIDGAQALAHIPVDVQSLDCDFYVCSGHKAYGPTGIGVLYGKSACLENLPPYQTGGEMIVDVTITQASYNTLPHRLEAGTPAIAQAIGFAESIRFLQSLSLTKIATHDTALLAYAKEQMGCNPKIEFIGNPRTQAGVLSFNLKGLHPHDVGTCVNEHGIAIRSGKHCTHPLLGFFGLESTCRISFGVYNSTEDIDALCVALDQTVRLLC